MPTISDQSKSDQQREFHPEYLIETIVEGIVKRGWCVAHTFFSQEQTAALLADAQWQWTEGYFHAAFVGKGSTQARRGEIRSDYLLWLEREAAKPAQMPYWDAMERLRMALNETLFLGAQSIEAHYAVYPAGAFYKRHRDQHRGSLERLISCVVYLNNEWAESDGGQLRIYDEDGTDFTDITPQAGTLVCFRSDTVEHEVMPALRERYSLTGWLRKGVAL